MQDEGKIFTEQPFYNRDPRRSRTSRSPQQPRLGRRILKFTLGLLLISVLVLGWSKLTAPETFPIHNVEIKGQFSRVDHNDLRQTILFFIQKGFVMLDVTSLQDRLLQLPWVASANIQRIWPDKIIISLTEQNPIARFGKNTLLNGEGTVFKVKPTTIPTNLPLFVGPLGQQKLMIQAYQTMTPVLASISRKITILALDTQEFWRLQLDNGIVLLIGKTDSLARLQRFVAVYSQVVDNKATLIDYIDLRYNHGMAVHFKNQNSATTG